MGNTYLPSTGSATDGVVTGGTGVAPPPPPIIIMYLFNSLKINKRKNAMEEGEKRENELGESVKGSDTIPA